MPPNPVRRQEEVIFESRPIDSQPALDGSLNQLRTQLPVGAGLPVSFLPEDVELDGGTMPALCNKDDPATLPLRHYDTTIQQFRLTQHYDRKSVIYACAGVSGGQSQRDSSQIQI